MTALSDVTARLDAVLVGRKPGQLLLKVGYGAERAIAIESPDKQLPDRIMGVEVQRTTQFSGWEVYFHGQSMG